MMSFGFSFLFALNGFLLIQTAVAQSNFTALPAASWHSATSDGSGMSLTMSSYSINSQLYYSTNGGIDWSISSQLGPFYSTVSNYDSGKYVLAVGENTYVSSNFGASFTEVSSDTGGNNCAGVSSSGQFMVFVSGSTPSTCVSFSTNYGTAFTSSLGPTSASGDCIATAINSAGSIVVLSVDGSGLWTSTDPTSASSWTQSYSSTTELTYIAYGGGNFYAGMSVSPLSILLSINGATSWTVQSTAPGTGQLAVDNSGEKVLLASSVLYYSVDSGVSFSKIDSTIGVALTCAMNGSSSMAIWAGNSYVFYGNPNGQLPTVTPTRAPTSAAPTPTSEAGPTFPSDPTYAISQLYSDAGCTDYTSMGSILVNTCLYADPNYFIFTCDGTTATNTFYHNSDCTVPTGSTTVFTLNTCSVNGGTEADYNLYMEITACGVTNPFYSFPDNMPTETYYADTACSEVITATAYVNDLCLQGSTTASGMVDWSTQVEMAYLSSPICEGTFTSTPLVTSCSSSSSGSYGFTNAYYNWQEVSSSTTSSVPTVAPSTAAASVTPTVTATNAPTYTITASPTVAPTVFPSDPTYVISQLYSDAGCTDYTSMGSIVTNTCLNGGANYFIFTCDGTTATNTFYTDSKCTIPTGSTTLFTLNTCSVNGGTNADYNLYMDIIACGVTNPFDSFPDTMPTETYYADTSCSEVITATAYVNDLCLQGSTSSSGLVDWSSQEQLVYLSSPACDGTYTSTPLVTSCSSSPSGSYGFADAYYYWQLVSTTTTDSSGGGGSSNSLSTGAVAGIAVGGVAVVVVLAALVYFYLFKASSVPLSRQQQEVDTHKI